MNFDSIPAEMRAFKQWICWKYVSQGGPKPTKVPYNPISGNFASVSQLDTWVSYENACLFSSGYDGIGFVLSHFDPYLFIDLDESFDEEEQALQMEIFEKFDTYSERSPSGKGLHLIAKAELIRGLRVGSIELYSSDRYMTMTGDVYADRPIESRQELATSLFDRLNTRRFAPVKSDGLAQSQDDLAVWQQACYAANGEKFQDLWAGRFDSYYRKPDGSGDQSKADFALVNILSFYSQNKEQIRRLFLQSSLGKRAKASRNGYLESMIDRSFDRALPEIDFSEIKRQSDLLRFSEKVEVEVDSEQVRVKEIEELTKEKSALRPTSIDDGEFSIPPGVTGLLAKFLYDQSFKAVPEIAISGAIAYMAGLCGKAYNCSNSGLNMYILLLAGTGRGKESIAGGLSKITMALSPHIHFMRDIIGPGQIASGQALLKYIGDHPTGSFLSIFGEFGITLKNLADSRNANDLNLQKVILDLFSKSGMTDSLNPSVYADSLKNVKQVKSPAFSFIGESIPDRFYTSISENMILTGLLPRLTVVEYLGLRPKSNHDHAFVVPPKALLEQMANVATQVEKLHAFRQVIHVDFSSEANELHLKLDVKVDHVINTSTNSIVAELWNRVHLRTVRLAALLAVGINPYVPIIDAECWRWAERFIVSGTENLVMRFEAGLIGDVATEDSQLRFVRQLCKNYLALTLTECKQSNIRADLISKKIITHSYIQLNASKQRCFREDCVGPSAAIKKAIQTMLDSGYLIEIPKAQVQREANSSSKAYYISVSPF